MDGVGAVEDGDAETGAEGRPLEHVGGVGPNAGLVGRGEGVAAVQDRAQEELGDVARRRQCFPVDLGHLPDLLVERHAGEQRFDVGRVDGR
jgi:hypothetical protein